MLIISYDITSDKIRSKFMTYIKKYGRRLQYSVYEINQSDRITRTILTQIEVDRVPLFENTDSVIIRPICKWCRGKIIRYGYSVAEEQEIVIV